MRTLKPLGYPAAKASSVTWVKSSQMSSAEAPGDTVRGQQRLRLVGSCNPEGQGELSLEVVTQTHPVGRSAFH